MESASDAPGQTRGRPPDGGRRQNAVARCAGTTANRCAPIFQRARIRQSWSRVHGKSAARIGAGTFLEPERAAQSDLFFLAQSRPLARDDAAVARANPRLA